MPSIHPSRGKGALYVDPSSVLGSMREEDRLQRFEGGVLQVVKGIPFPRPGRIVKGGLPSGEEPKIRLLHGDSPQGYLPSCGESGVTALFFQPLLLTRPEVLSVDFLLLQPFEGPEQILFRDGTPLFPGGEIKLAKILISTLLLLPRDQGILPLSGKVVYWMLGNALEIP